MRAHRGSRGTCGQAKYLSRNVAPAASRRLLGVTANQAAGAKKAAKPCEICTDKEHREPAKELNREQIDEDFFFKGPEQRKATLGAEYVENNLAAAVTLAVLFRMR